MTDKLPLWQWTASDIVMATQRGSLSAADVTDAAITRMDSANPALKKSLMDVPVRVDVVLGELRMPIEELMAMAEGDIVALERHTGEPVDIYLSDRLMARGKLVIADGQLGVTLSEIVDDRAAA